MIRHPHRPLPVLCRSELFREQVGRFRRSFYRKPSFSELRAIWAGTGFNHL